jgi:transcriptional regulator with XRE-family HTH domain
MAGPEPRRPVGRPEAHERTLGERIHRHRVRAGLSRTQLSGLIGKSPSWLYKVERGVLAPPDRISVLSELARVLRIELDDLITDPVSPAAAGAVRRAATSAAGRAAARPRSRPAAALPVPVPPPIEAFDPAGQPAAAPSPPLAPTIDRRAVPPVRSRTASDALRRRGWRVWTVLPAIAVTAAAAIALVAVLPDAARHATRTRLRDQAAVPQAVLTAPPPVVAPGDVAPATPAPELPPPAPPQSMRPVAAVVGSASVHPPRGTAAVPRPAGPRPALSSAPWSPPACSRVAFDGDTGPMNAYGGWVYRLTVRPGGSLCASWDSPEVEGALVGPGLMRASGGNGTLTGSNLPGGTYTLALRPRPGARSDHTHVRIAVS